ncbi:MAG TPA: adenylate/guanylate cyclase domain-containing protein [Gemmatimonadaceae bacterium]|nr:adenylate/guanylate cyclase domain-containing protein [Gemmatimonadaceae bacterium]
MKFKLTSADNLQTFDLKGGAPMVVGRAPTSDIPVFDPTISRRHAEVTTNEKGVHVRDLGSSNGTFHNGSRVESATLSVGDTITFGKVAFKLNQVGGGPAPSAKENSGPAGATIVRQLPVRNTPGSAFAAIKSGEQAAVSAEEDKVQQKLSILLEVSKELGRSVDPEGMLQKIAEQAYQILTVDRVAIQLMDDNGNLVTKIARDKRGTEQQRAVPQSIARAAMNDKVAILSDNAGEDQRFGGQSILMQQVRSAICSPLMGSQDRVLGVLYVDNVSASHRFNEDDLNFVVAFSGIAAVAIENSQFAERIRREALARSNFERYFTPQLAQRIASSEGATRLGGDKREVTVLFSDIRGFTALSETMPPAEMAMLLTDYFTEMVDCVFRNEGTLDKFIGDAVMAQWGAPIGTPEDPDKAMNAAIEMMNELEKLNEKWKSEGRPQLHIGIGINHGEAFAGNIGSEKRLEYTVIGDTVNTASRLCSAAGPGEILISDEMKKVLAKAPKVKEMPPMELKNKSQPVKVYKVVI